MINGPDEVRDSEVDPLKRFLELESTMFFKAKAPIVTASTCLAMEKIRLFLEVATGERVRIKHLDFRTQRGAVFLGQSKIETNFDFTDYYGCVSGMHTLFKITLENQQMDARFNLGWDEVQVRISQEGDHPLGVRKVKVLIGRSYIERKEVPFESVNYHL